MDSLSNQEIRQRLLALGYNAPPVTDTTRSTLLKKLSKLESNAAPVANNLNNAEIKSRKTRSKTQETPEKIEYKNFSIDKSPPRQTRSKIEEYDKVDSTSSAIKKSKTSTPFTESFSKRDPFERGSDSDDSVSFSVRSALARKPLSPRRESEYFSSPRIPSVYRKYDADNGASSYLNKDIQRSKPSSKVNRWSKRLSSQISFKKITPSVVLLAFGLFFVLLAGIYFSKNDRQYGDVILDDLKYTKCGERVSSNEPCIPDDEIEASMKCLKTIYRTLYKNEVDRVCRARTSTSAKFTLTPENATELLVTEVFLLRYEAEKMIKHVKLIADKNPQVGIVFESRDGFKLQKFDLPWKCTFASLFSVFFDYAFYVAAAVPLLFSMHVLLRWGVNRHQEKAKDKQDLIKGILEILQQNAIANPSQSYLPIVHVRDQLILYKDRERKKKIWAEAVKYVEENESRIRREVQPYQGEDYDVWRWVGGHQMSFPKPKTWHGEAFETSKDTMNTPSTSPTPCLKIRNMFDPKNESSSEDWITGVKDAILERCEGVHVIHMVVDETNPEGCVYIKCASTDDAGKAYRKMHGAWFDGKIVSVKFLRLERYHERYPASIGLTQSLVPSNDQKRSII